MTDVSFMPIYFLYVSLEKITPKELNADNNFISQCLFYLETCGNTVAMYGKLGSGKRTLAAQVAIRLANKDTNIKIKIVRKREDLSDDLQSRLSTIFVIHDPIKAWYTSQHTDEITSFLYKICTNAKRNNCYIIAIFHCNDWESFKHQIGKNSIAIEQMFQNAKHICFNKQKMIEILTNCEIKNKVKYQIDRATIGDLFLITLFLKNCVFQDKRFLSNPIKFIFEKLKSLQQSSIILHQLTFKVMVFFVVHNGEIAKRELDDISRHSLFADVKEKMDIVGSIDECINQLLELFIEKTVDGQSYRILHEVVTRCTFLAAVEMHRTLLFAECDPMLIMDCMVHKTKTKNQIAYDFNDIGIPSNIIPEIARLIFQRTEMRSVLQNSILYDDKEFLDEWKKAELHFSNEIHVKIETVN